MTQEQEKLQEAKRWMGALPRDQFELILAITDDIHLRANRRADAAIRAANDAYDRAMKEILGEK